MNIESALWNIVCRIRGKGWQHNRLFPPSFRVYEENGHLEFRTSNGNSTSALLAQTMENTQSGDCNIILSGPSVKSIQEPELLGKRYTIAVNGSPELLMKNNVACNAYIVSDPRYLQQKTSDFLQYARYADYCFLSYSGIVALLNLGVRLDGITIRVFDRRARPFRQHRPSQPLTYFARSFDKGLGPSSTVAYAALQIAYCLGFRTVYLFGLDLSLEGRFYSEDRSQPTALHKNWDENILQPFSLIGNMVAGGEWKVINCSMQSRLPESIQPKMDPNQAL